MIWSVMYLNRQWPMVAARTILIRTVIMKQRTRDRER